MIHNDPETFVKEQGWPYRISSDSKEIETGCPFSDCPNFNEQQFYIARESGKWYCHRCNNRGRSIRSLAYRLGIQFNEKNDFKLTDQNVNLFHNDFKRSENKSYLYNIRQLSSESCAKYNIGVVFSNGRCSFVFPIYNALGKLVGIQYRHLEGESKITFEKGSQLVPYNINNVDRSKDTLIVVEGYIDCISLVQYGFENVVSMPNGVNNVGDWIDEIKGFKKYILALDNDKAGENGVKLLAEKLGITKCFRWRPRKGLKDWNEYLQCDISSNEIKSEFVSNIYSLFNYRVDTAHEIQNILLADNKKDNYKLRFTTGYSVFDTHLGLLRLGEVTVLSGKASHGKTTFSTTIVANLIKHGVTCSIISPEMKTEDLFIDLVRNHFHKFYVSDDEIKCYTELAGNKVRFIDLFGEWTSKSESIHLNHLFDIIEYEVTQNGVKFFLLDHLRLLTFCKRPEDERFAIENFITRCVRSATGLNIHIWLVVQPGKTYNPITENDLKGSANIGQDAHNVILMHREPNGVVRFDVTKVRHKTGQIGSFVLKYDLSSKANYYETNE